MNVSINNHDSYIPVFLDIVLWALLLPDLLLH